MRVIVLFDLPMESSEERREYTKFRKFLIKNGFIMMQKSIYTKLAFNYNAAQAIIESVRAHKTPIGLIQIMVVTEKQYQKMECIVGTNQSATLDTTDRTVIL